VDGQRKREEDEQQGPIARVTDAAWGHDFQPGTHAKGFLHFTPDGLPKANRAEMVWEMGQGRQANAVDWLAQIAR
jgi:hypothetical protein